jgi:glycerol-3-phosphate cytidylyltransferase-like family protein
MHMSDSNKNDQNRVGKIIDYSGARKEKENLVIEERVAPVLRSYEELKAYLKDVDRKTRVATSGYFNPIHKNHISNIISSKYLEPEFLMEHELAPEVHLTVIVNGDWSTREKLGGELFMTAEHRADIVRAIHGVDLVFIHEVESTHQAPLIELGLFHIFTKGGDRDFDSLPREEQEAIIATGTLMVGNVGFEKHEGTDNEISSSRLRSFAKGKGE